jgi:hypothetical protein
LIRLWGADRAMLPHPSRVRSVPARLCTAPGNGEEISLDLILFERFWRTVGLHCGIRHCFADSCLHEAYLPGCDLLDATAMPSPPCALFVCASACPARSRQAGIFIARVCVDSARRSGRAHNHLRARTAPLSRTCTMFRDGKTPHPGLARTLSFWKFLERAKGLEPSTPTLARSCSTTELHPHPGLAAITRRQRQSYAKCGLRMQQPAQGGKSASAIGRNGDLDGKLASKGAGARKAGSIGRDRRLRSVPPIANPASKRQLGLETGKEYPTADTGEESRDDS